MGPSRLVHTFGVPVALAIAFITLSLLPATSGAAFSTSTDNAANVFAASALYAGTPRLADDFNTGSVWDTTKWSNVSNTGSFQATMSVTGGAGRMALNKVGMVGRMTSITSPTTFTDQGVYFRLRFSTASTNNLTARVGLRSDGAANSNNCTTCYWLEINNGVASNGVSFTYQKANNGNGGPAFNVATNANTNWWNYRFEVVGQTLYAKRWADGANEPTAWGATLAVPASYQVASGKLWVETIEYNANASEYSEWDDITYYSVP